MLSASVGAIKPKTSDHSKSLLSAQILGGSLVVLESQMRGVGVEEVSSLRLNEFEIGVLDIAGELVAQRLILEREVVVERLGQ